MMKRKKKRKNKIFGMIYYLSWKTKIKKRVV
jgi:hypothetical protein